MLLEPIRDGNFYRIIPHTLMSVTFMTPVQFDTSPSSLTSDNHSAQWLASRTLLAQTL
jgi:hypothetical protein